MTSRAKASQEAVKLLLGWSSLEPVHDALGDKHSLRGLAERVDRGRPGRPSPPLRGAGSRQAVGRPDRQRTKFQRCFFEREWRADINFLSTFYGGKTSGRDRGCRGAARRRQMRHAIAAPLPHGSRGASVGAAPGRGRGGRHEAEEKRKEQAGRPGRVSWWWYVVVEDGGPHHRGGKKKDSCWVCRWVGR